VGLFKWGFVFWGLIDTSIRHHVIARGTSLLLWDMQQRLQLWCESQDAHAYAKKEVEMMMLMLTSMDTSKSSSKSLDLVEFTSSVMQAIPGLTFVIAFVMAVNVVFI